MSTAEIVAARIPVAAADAMWAADLAHTPVLALSPDLAAARLAQLRAALPRTRLHYAVKANPHPALLRRLVVEGASFDVASPAEVQLVLAAGGRPGQLLYSNPIRARTDIAAAAAAGVRTFVVDTVGELRKTADEAPGSAILCRLTTSGRGSDWPLSRKYGATPDECLEILTAAPALGLEAAGVAFHVGSQQRDPHAWDQPIAAAADVFRVLDGRGIRPRLLDLGGGFPAASLGDSPSLAEYGAAINAAVDRSFGASQPITLAEPGRAVVADAGVLVATVVAVCWRGGRRWVYLDAGVFTGLVETLDEAIRYRLDVPSSSAPAEPCVLAGPTCDSADVLYEREPAQLPNDLAEGDRVLIRGAGAYTSCYSTVGFNGFPPLSTVLVRELP